MSPSASADEDVAAARDARVGVDGAESAAATPTSKAALAVEDGLGGNPLRLIGAFGATVLSESEPEDRSDEDDEERRARSGADMLN
jgi:hypothetical protein